MIDIIKNYEFALNQIKDGLDAYQLLTVEGTIGKRESGQELTADVTANSVVLKAKRHTNYKFYLYILNNVSFAINNLRDPHEGLITKLLFLDGMKYLKEQEYLEKDYRMDVYSISATTFAEKRRKAIAGIANSLKINRTIDFVIIDMGVDEIKKERSVCACLKPNKNEVISSILLYLSFKEALVNSQ